MRAGWRIPVRYADKCKLTPPARRALLLPVNFVWAELFSAWVGEEGEVGSFAQGGDFSEKTGIVSDVTSCRATGVHTDKDHILIAIGFQFHDALGVAGLLTFFPEFITRAAEIMGFTGFN